MKVQTKGRLLVAAMHALSAAVSLVSSVVLYHAAGWSPFPSMVLILAVLTLFLYPVQESILRRYTDEFEDRD